jgi:hypothetical protein
LYVFYAHGKTGIFLNHVACVSTGGVAGESPAEGVAAYGAVGCVAIGKTDTQRGAASRYAQYAAP